MHKVSDVPDAILFFGSDGDSTSEGAIGLQLNREAEDNARRPVLQVFSNRLSQLFDAGRRVPCHAVVESCVSSRRKDMRHVGFRRTPQPAASRKNLQIL